jgi:hypothetical protein
MKEEVGLAPAFFVVLIQASYEAEGAGAGLALNWRRTPVFVATRNSVAKLSL